MLFRVIFCCDQRSYTPKSSVVVVNESENKNENAQNK